MTAIDVRPPHPDEDPREACFLSESISWSMRTPHARALTVARASAAASSEILSRTSTSGRSPVAFAELAPIAAADAVLQSCAERRSWPSQWFAQILPGEIILDESVPLGDIVLDVAAPCSAVRVAKNLGVALVLGDRVHVALPRGTVRPILDYFRAIAARVPADTLEVGFRSARKTADAIRIVIDDSRTPGAAPRPDETPDWMGALTQRFLTHRTVRVPLGDHQDPIRPTR